MAKAKKIKVKPVPEAIESGPWIVRRGRGSVELNTKQVLVPFDNTTEAQTVRAHEMGHIKWSPKSIPHSADINPNSLQCTEDARINGKLRNLNITLEHEFNDLEMQILKDSSEVEQANMYIATRSISGCNSQVAKVVPEKISSKCEQLHRYLLENPTFERTLEVARQITAFFGNEEDQDDFEGTGLSPIEMEVAEGELDDGCDITKVMGIRTDDGRDVPWGELKVEKMPMPLRLPQRIRERMVAKSNSDTGAVPNRIDRFCSDGKIFQTKRKKKHLGGTLLIDHSGSMSIDHAELIDVLEMMPLATIAFYSGQSRKGVLRIVAQKGRRMEKKKLLETSAMMPGANVVDGPALKWLVKNERPRIWVCDGLVTGIGDAACAKLTLEAERIAKNGRVIRLPEVSELRKHFTKDW